MKDEFNAKMLGRVGRGQLTEVKFFKRTLRWDEQEMCFSWRGARCAAWTYRHLSCDEDTNSRNEANWRRRSRCPGAFGYFAGSNLPLSGGIYRIHRPGQTWLPVCGESGEKCYSRGYEARLVANDASGQVPGGAQRTLKCMMCLRNTWCAETQTGRARKRAATQENGEAELYATGRAAAGGLQAVQLLAEAEWI